ncbi:MAG: cyclic nucleotide-binding domain-containing protein [Gammaproteobacteria bacterium]|nr:cyclic nucleotide-binding domain-containing protein [Rhodocyclaceae bacterium]MBU3908987.1 cyclic nucleotide-binding domain-containing protein [Gammaproteobacteria bacterium]MBU3988671.1 cyclic nucleotide-binding domain-containing protein [Gammaproteobacteria bacterium]MBU4005858.1 cyclic nucleotide-binding domain-containing protein [Gammaproteobacteria bacterium]MBU4021622.1 cyclic nucleotide-binding domain-containing protein [Gammaproteobacteria bacterium]
MSWIREQFTFHDLQRLLFKLAERVKAFQGLKPAEISELLARTEKCSFEAGAQIVKEGSVGNHMYIILDGEAVVSKKGRDGELELARLSSADSFGEMALADNEARSATVSALSPCVLVRLSDQLLNSHPEIGMKVYRNIARVVSARLRSADEALAWRI